MSFTTLLINPRAVRLAGGRVFHHPEGRIDFTANHAATPMAGERTASKAGLSPHSRRK